MRSIRKDINYMVGLLFLFFIYFIVNNIDFITDLIVVLVVYGTLGMFIFKGIKYLVVTFKYKDRQFSKNEIINKVENMSPREFEIFCGNIFKQAGYKVTVTEATCDGGKDIIAVNDEDIIYIECKHYAPNNLVGREILQKLIGSSIGGGATRAILITTSDYNSNAYTYAKTVEWLDLWTMEDILDVMNKIEKPWYTLCNLKG